MKPTLILLAAAAAIPLAACASKDKHVANTAVVDCAAIGDPALANVKAGTPVGGVYGATWADANQDGCVEGYMRDGQYRSGSPYYQQNDRSGGSYRRGERG